MLYVHTERLSLPLDALGRKLGRWVLALNPTEYECHGARVIDMEVIGRAEGPWDGHGWMQISPAEYANALGSRLPMLGLWGVTLPNEPNDGDPQWMAEAVREIRSRWPHLYVLVGCWANGHDGFPVPVAAEDAPWIIYNFHGYGRPDKPEMVLYAAPYLALRYRDTMRQVRAVQPNAVAMIGEFGCTKAAPDFQDNGRCDDDVSLLNADGFNFDAYRDSILAFQSEIAKDSYVVAAFLFEFGAWDKWRTMEHLGTPIEDWWRGYARPARVSASESNPSEPGGNPDGGEENDMPEFVLGFADVAAALGPNVVGEPQADEKTLKNPDGSVVLAVQPTTTGMMMYVPGGQPGFYPKA